MVCPNCHSEYTPLNPCECSAPDFPALPQRNPKPEVSSDAAAVKSSVLKPTGIGDPFWH